MKRPFRMGLAIVLIFVVFVMWLILTLILGWKHGGGMVIQMTFLGLAIYLWITITKKTPDEKVVVKTIKAIFGFFAIVLLCFLASAFIVTPTINGTIQRHIQKDVTPQPTP